MMEKIIGTIIICIIGIICTILGYLMWKKEKISILHSYYYDKVLEENKKGTTDFKKCRLKSLKSVD